MCINFKILGQCSSLIVVQREDILLRFLKEFNGLQKIAIAGKGPLHFEIGIFRVYRKNKEKDWPKCRGKSYSGIIKCKRISDGLFLTWYLWTFIDVYPFTYLILSAGPNTTYFMLQGGKKEVSAWMMLSFTMHFLPQPDPVVKSKWQICDIIIIFFLQEQTVKPLTQDGDFTAGSNRASG